MIKFQFPETFAPRVKSLRGAHHFPKVKLIRSLPPDRLLVVSEDSLQILDKFGAECAQLEFSDSRLTLSNIVASRVTSQYLVLANQEHIFVFTLQDLQFVGAQAIACKHAGLLLAAVDREQGLSIAYSCAGMDRPELFHCITAGGGGVFKACSSPNVRKGHWTRISVLYFSKDDGVPVLISLATGGGMKFWEYGEREMTYRREERERSVPYCYRSERESLWEVSVHRTYGGHWLEINYTNLEEGYRQNELLTPSSRSIRITAVDQLTACACIPKSRAVIVAAGTPRCGQLYYLDAEANYLREECIGNFSSTALLRQVAVFGEDNGTLAMVSGETLCLYELGY